MSFNKINLNLSKTEFSNNCSHLIDKSPFSIFMSHIIPKTIVKILGVNLGADHSSNEL